MKKLQVIEPFSAQLGSTYSIGDVIEVDDATAESLIATGRAIEGEVKPFENFQPLAALWAKNTQKPAPKTQTQTQPKPQNRRGATHR